MSNEVTGNRPTRICTVYLVSVDPILLGLDRQIQAKGGDLAILLERFWIH